MHAMNAPWIWLIWVVGAYLVGSIPFGLLIGLAQGVDIRAQGSGNVGATNTGRLLGRRWGITCFVLDVSKGLGPVLAYGLWTGQAGVDVPAAATGALPAAQWLALAVAAIIGHIFPIWLRLRGGKGVATGLGAVLGLWPVLTLPGFAAAVVWLIVLKLTGFVSLASMVAAGVLPIATLISAWLLGLTAGEMAIYLAVTLALAALVVIRHRSNIAKLRAGTESRTTWLGPPALGKRNPSSPDHEEAGQRNKSA